ncbi:acyl carrier protein [Saccharomonospora piscinae]|uniref:Acyl carrier protein n=1 Tax=Saccharomonospora piscinae TaxID=687388 RepID=W5VG50_SACPI|nr:acyl carrier protein [Saccharomonospora piscinae]AHH53522.1 acyl carrier protein [Saccharomonospora piscinae]OQO89716.1 methoxymalonate biosynthesis protein [Saccharomonospora piscinae]TLW91396.1 acyl carrier protein [Saccharomonospora piscinae]
MTTTNDEQDAAAIEAALLELLEARTKTDLTPDQELFASGLVSSMFAMELIVHLEQTYQLSITGPDLKLDNFRTVAKMTALVLRLRDDSTVHSGA